MFYLQRLQKYDFVWERNNGDFQKQENFSFCSFHSYTNQRRCGEGVEGVLEAERHFGNFGESRPCCSSLETLVLHFGRAQV